MKQSEYSLTIGWLFPKLMSTYGDRGNIIALQKRCEWRGIKIEVLNIDQSINDQYLMTIDLLFGGGAQDREQGIVMKDLYKKKGAIKKLIEKNTPALFVCGSPQLMGNYYEPLEGKRIEGLGIFDMKTVHQESKQERLIGNIIAEIDTRSLDYPLRDKVIVGFENHGGRTYLGKNVKPFAKVLKGFGNNGKDGTEGAVYKNAIGCYFHGPLLPKNPSVADFLIQKALQVKYDKEIKLQTLNDSLENKARYAIAKKLGYDII